jgi:hypothetical protein
MIIIISNVKRAMDDSSTGAEETETTGYPARSRSRARFELDIFSMTAVLKRLVSYCPLERVR